MVVKGVKIMEKGFLKNILIETIKNIFNIVITNNIFKYLGILVVIAVIIKIFKPQIKGYIGEKTINFMLKKLPEDYKIVNDIFIKNDGWSSQIDHIIISKFGIFVIETKTYKGWIYGKEKQKQWTQNLYGKKYYFQNPLHQNYGHIQNLKKIKGLEEIDFISLILFSGEATLKNEINNVIYFSKAKKWISSYQKIIYNDKQVDFIYNTILNNNIVDKKARNEHINSIKIKKGSVDL